MHLFERRWAFGIRKEIHSPEPQPTADTLTRYLATLDGFAQRTFRHVEHRCSALDVDQLVFERAPDLRLHCRQQG